MGFIDFVEMSGDSATFTLSSCNAGQHHLSLTYALGESTDHPGPRPMQITVNGVAQASPIEFPVTGSWTEWGKVFTQVQLLTGPNTVTISAIANSGPNIDYIEVYPLGDEAQGIARVAVDNSCPLRATHTRYPCAEFVYADLYGRLTYASINAAQVHVLRQQPAGRPGLRLECD